MTCNTSFAANNLINSQQINTIWGYSCEIPQNYIYSVGIVHDVPLDFIEKEILEASAPEDKITKVERIQRWDVTLKKEVPTEAIKITLKSFELPDRVHIYRVPMRVSQFVDKPFLCKNCKSYGHLKKHCRAEKVCERCYQNHEVKDCPKKQQVTCKGCKSYTHFTGQKVCPEQRRQTEIAKTRARLRTTFKEAEKIYNNEYPTIKEEAPKQNWKAVVLVHPDNWRDERTNNRRRSTTNFIN